MSEAERTSQNGFLCRRVCMTTSCRICIPRCGSSLSRLETRPRGQSGPTEFTPRIKQKIAYMAMTYAPIERRLDVAAVFDQK
jgi:hypothetical protein